MSKINFERYINIPSLMKTIKPETCILDIGSADATERIGFRSYFDGPIYYFEADPRWNKELDKIEKEDNNFVIRKALCSTEGEVELYQSESHKIRINGKLLVKKNWRYSSNIKSVSKQFKDRWSLTFKDRSVTVPSTTLDNWDNINNIKEIDLIWLKAVGAEADIIKSGINVINKTRYIYITYTCKNISKDFVSYKEIKKKFLADFETVYMNINYVLLKRVLKNIV